MKISSEAQEILDWIERDGIRVVGREDYIHYLKGGRRTQKQAISSNCYACMGYYADGKCDCENPICPLYPFSPSNPHRGRSVHLSDTIEERLKERSKLSDIGNRTGGK